MRALTADEGGLAPPFASAEAMLDDAAGAIEQAGYTPGKEVSLAVDVASSHFYADGYYHLGDESLDSAGMIRHIAGWLDRYPIVSVEDGLAEEDWANWPALRQAIGGRALTLGDDFLCTNPQRIQRAIDEKRDIYLGLKDTVIAGYDGVMRTVIEEIYERDYKEKVAQSGLSYHYELIDAQAARIVANPPERALWGVPDNTTGRKLFKLVNTLKLYGIPSRKHHVSISRMSAGGGDQYGSFNMPAAEDGILKIILDGEEVHARRVGKNDPILFMSNDHRAIKDWISQVFRDASLKGKEVYFGLKREYMQYDEAFSKVITDARQELADAGTQPPSFMIMRPSAQLKKMITDPPRSALYPAQNLDGDIFSDISAALGGSLATASSIIESTDGTMLYEAPHGTAHDLYLKYLASGGKEALFNPSALIFALSNALETLAIRSDNSQLLEYSGRLKNALIDTVDQGIITGDLKGKTTAPEDETVVDMVQFLDAVERNLHN